MQSIAIIGCGAIGEAVGAYLANSDNVEIGVAIVNPGREARAREIYGKNTEVAHAIGNVGTTIDVAVDCAGHPALRQHGEAILARGIDLITVSSGALADTELLTQLQAASRAGGAQLRVVAGAIGALDTLAAARVGKLTHVTYRGRKPPQGSRISTEIFFRNRGAIAACARPYGIPLPS